MLCMGKIVDLRRSNDVYHVEPMHRIIWRGSSTRAGWPSARSWQSWRRLRWRRACGPAMSSQTRKPGTATTTAAATAAGPAAATGTGTGIETGIANATTRAGTENGAVLLRLPPHPMHAVWWPLMITEPHHHQHCNHSHTHVFQSQPAVWVLTVHFGVVGLRRDVTCRRRSRSPVRRHAEVAPPGDLYRSGGSRHAPRERDREYDRHRR